MSREYHILFTQENMVYDYTICMLCVVGGVAIEPGHTHGPLFGTGRITMYRKPLCTVLSDDSFHNLREYEIMPNI